METRDTDQVHSGKNARGRAYGREMRERFAAKRMEGKSVQTIANELCIHRDTVRAWATRAKAMDATDKSIVPPAKPRGGDRSSKLSREHRILLGQLAMKTRLPLEGLAAYAKEIDSSFPQLATRDGNAGDPQAQRVATKREKEVISRSTVHHALTSLGLSHAARRRVDPKQSTSEAHTNETAEFQKEQLRSAPEDQRAGITVPENPEAPRGVLHADNLLFMDESNFQLNMTDKTVKGWTTGKSNIEYVTKGKTQYISVVACMGLVFQPDQNYSGVRFTETSKDRAYRNKAYRDLKASLPTDDKGKCTLYLKGKPLDLRQLPNVADVRNNINEGFFLVHYIVPPQRPQLVIGAYYTAENAPTNVQDAPGDVAQLVENLRDNPTKKDIEDATNFLYVNGVEERRMENDKAQEDLADMSTLADRVDQLNSGDWIGLPRRFFTNRNFAGGRKESHISTSYDFLRFLRWCAEIAHVFFGHSILQDIRFGMDNASTHGAVLTGSSKASYLHNYVRETLRVRGAVFIPSLKPRFDPVESLFRWTKHHITSNELPSRGEFTVEELTGLITSAFKAMAGHKSFAVSWLNAGCYPFRSKVDGASVRNFCKDRWRKLDPPRESLKEFHDKLDDLEYSLAKDTEDVCITNFKKVFVRDGVFHRGYNTSLKALDCNTERCNTEGMGIQKREKHDVLVGILQDARKRVKDAEREIQAIPDDHPKREQKKKDEMLRVYTAFPNEDAPDDCFKEKCMTDQGKTIRQTLAKRPNPNPNNMETKRRFLGDYGFSANGIFTRAMGALAAAWAPNVDVQEVFDDLNPTPAEKAVLNALVSSISLNWPPNGIMKRLKKVFLNTPVDPKLIQGLDAASTVYVSASTLPPFVRAIDTRRKNNDTTSSGQRWAGYPLASYSHGLTFARDVAMHRDKTYNHIFPLLTTDTLWVFARHTLQEETPNPYGATGSYKYAYYQHMIAFLGLQNVYDATTWPKLQRNCSKWNRALQRNLGAPMEDDDALLWPCLLISTIGEWKSQSITKTNFTRARYSYLKNDARIAKINAEARQGDDAEWLVADVVYGKTGGGADGRRSYSISRGEPFSTVTVIPATEISLPRQCAHVEANLRAGIPVSQATIASTTRGAEREYTNCVRPKSLPEAEQANLVKRLYKSQLDELLITSSRPDLFDALDRLDEVDSTLNSVFQARGNLEDLDPVNKTALDADFVVLTASDTTSDIFKRTDVIFRDARKAQLLQLMERREREEAARAERTRSKKHVPAPPPRDSVARITNYLGMRHEGRIQELKALGVNERIDLLEKHDSNKVRRLVADVAFADWPDHIPNRIGPRIGHAKYERTLLEAVRKAAAYAGDKTVITGDTWREMNVPVAILVEKTLLVPQREPFYVVKQSTRLSDREFTPVYRATDTSIEWAFSTQPPGDLGVLKPRVIRQ